MITETLINDGWTIKSKCVDAGGYMRASKWLVKISRNGRSFTTKYQQGSAYRVWKNLVCFSIYGIDSWWRKYIRRGEVVKDLPNMRLSNAVEEFNLLTEPSIPTLQDVLWCLFQDANSVRFGATFSEWCEDLGYDTDSRKAKKVYNTCVKTWLALVSMGTDFEKLETLYENY